MSVTPAPDRAPTSMWALRKDFRDYVRTVKGDRLVLCVGGQITYLDRPTARLLAKRINQCLDATVKP